MKKIIAIVVILILGIGITAMEVHWIQREKSSEKISVVGIVGSVASGEVLEPRNLKLFELDKTLVHEAYYRRIEEAVGQTTLVEMTEKTLLTKSVIKESAFDVPNNGNAITALKLDPELALCWELKVGEMVQVVMVKEVGSYEIIGDVRIKGLFDNYLNKEHVPSYALIEGKTHIVAKIIGSRDLGRMELTKQGSHQSIK